MEELEKLYTVEELCEILHVGRRSVYGWIADGKIEGSKIGKRWFFTADQIREMLKKAKR